MVKRVSVNVSLSSFVDRKRKAVTGYSNGCAEGSQIEIFYKKTSSNTVQFFTNNDPDCRGKRWQVVGTVKFYANAYDEVYIDAESIQ